MKKILIFLFCAGLLAGCAAQVPRDALRLAPDSLQDRQLQTRRFETTDKAAMLAAATGVLQDLGFSLEEADVPLGVLVGSKKREAASASQLAGAFLIAALGGGSVPVDTHQTIRVSMVMRQNAGGGGEHAPPQGLSPQDLGRIRLELEKSLAAALRKRHSPEISEKVARQAAENSVQALERDMKALLSVSAGRGDSLVRVTFQRVVFDSEGRISRAEQINAPEIYRQFYS